VKGLSGKVPKAVAACLDVLLSALRAFGVRVVKPSPLLKAAAGLLDHKDGAVRVGVKDISARTRGDIWGAADARRRWSWRDGWARRR